MRTVAYCEQDRYAQSVLISRMAEGKLHRAPIWDDVQTLTGDMLPPIDIIFGGFPCQDISVAGNGVGLDGKRSGLFFEIIRLTKETRAPFVFLENVPAIRTRGLREVIGAFTEIGYDCRWTCLSAASVGAPHKRERWFLLANSNSVRELSKQNSGQEPLDRASYGGQDVANTGSSRCEKQHASTEPGGPGHNSGCTFEGGGNAWWETEPAVGRVVDGVSNRVDRIKCLGNSVVPLQVRTAFKALAGIAG
ncbi:DNA cytosine methyltransferase [Bdellovibrio sp. HCB288]|uniref:DNA cytosine methyltransferase n=1 Tax=Bdellovibrio sp. HCB288 TaxID=3394355 RepID=UPI0039B6A8E9